MGTKPQLPSLSDPLPPEHQAGFEGLQAEECGILNGCENGRCVRVREGYTCDCFEGFQLDTAHMACVGKFRIRVAMQRGRMALMAPCGKVRLAHCSLRDTH